jgi:hypothetical protein
MRPDPKSAWFAWKTAHPTLKDHPEEVWSAAYLMGARDAIKASAKLAELAPMLGQLILWLESDPEWVTGESEPTNPEPTNLRT